MSWATIHISYRFFFLRFRTSILQATTWLTQPKPLGSIVRVTELVGSQSAPIGTPTSIHLLGQNVILNCITGHYHRPRPEQRVFLFIDIEGSTTLAERLGDLAFHRLVDRFVIDLSGAEVPRPVAGRP